MSHSWVLKRNWAISKTLMALSMRKSQAPRLRPDNSNGHYPAAKADKGSSRAQALRNLCCALVAYSADVFRRSGMAWACRP